MTSRKSFVRKKIHGFTLIEVMVVIAMIGILAAIAVPIYTNYVYRARATEGVAALEAIKTFMLERRSSEGKWPDTTQVKNEFSGLNDLYYFNASSISVTVQDPNTATVTLPVNITNFGSSKLTSNSSLILTLNWHMSPRVAYTGDVKTNYANHLK